MSAVLPARHLLLISPLLSLLTNFMFCITRVSPVSAQVVLCDIAGCLNGVCLDSPIVSQPTCNCSTGFRSYTDANVCEDIDECRLDSFRCGYSYPDSYSYRSYYSYLHNGYPSYWPLVPAGRCVNTPGSYYCLCYPPNRPVNRGAGCIYPQRRQPRPCGDVLAFSLLSEL